jgi:putative acyl-CoA dehydrogenase
MSDTYAVTNQSSPLTGYNLFQCNRPLQEALRFHGALNTPAHAVALDALGALAGSAEMQAQARLANVLTPQLHTHDRYGRRIDQVEFHPAYHALMAAAVGHGLHGTPWAEPPGSGAHLRRAAAFMLLTELEPSVLCPISMTYAVTPALRANAALLADWQPLLTATRYDPAFAPMEAKRGATMGMGMTEKQGGSDVRANTTSARFEAADGWGRRYRLTGHKWFLSAPMSDAFLVLAQAPGGPSCFFLPRWLPHWLAAGIGDERVNRFHIQRLKDKLGNRANASAEVEFLDAAAWLVGEEGRGVAQILEMGTLTRLDCALGTTGLMRQALSLALHHTAERHAFGKRLAEHALMKNVLADLAVEYEGALALSLRLARAVDRSEAGDALEAALRRLITPVAKLHICKRGAAFAQEAMECLGGNGYVEEYGEGVMARIYREMPVNSIWEGAGNIMALDLLRALRGRDAEALLTALEQELAPARGGHADFDRFATRLPDTLRTMDESGARRAAEQLALALQGALLVRHAPDAVADAFCRTRLAGEHGHSFGTLPTGCDPDVIVSRHFPG